MNFILELFIRGAAVALVGLLAYLAAKRMGVSLQARMLALMILSLLALPAVVSFAPRWSIIPAPTAPVTGSAAKIESDDSIYVSSLPAQELAPVDLIEEAASPPHRKWEAPHIFLAIYCLGVSVSVLILALATLKLRRIHRDSLPADDSRIPAELRDVVRVANHRGGVPMTYGLWRATILLPHEWRDWSDERLRAVLAHEEAHVKRRDPLMNMLAHLARAIHWPNPLVWWLVRKWRETSECACDELALESGIARDALATAIYDLARQNQEAMPLLASGMATVVEHRVRRVLEHKISRSIWRGNLVIALSLILGAMAGVLAQKPLKEEESLKALLKKAEEHFQVGAYDDAQAIYHQILRLDRYSAEARRGLEQVDLRRGGLIRVVDENWEIPVPEPSAGGGNDALDTIKAKLDRLIIPEFDAGPMTLSEAIELLGKLSIEQDSEETEENRKGVNILIDERKLKASSPESLTKKFSLQLSDVPLGVILKYLTELTEVSMRVEPYAVVIVPKEDRRNALFTRRYRIPDGAFEDSPKSYLEERGIEFEVEGSSALYIPKQRALVVRHTAETLNKIDEIVSSLLVKSESGYVIYTAGTDRFTVKNRELCQEQLPPFSTYKIPNTLFALEFGLVDSPSSSQTYPAENYPQQEWWPQSWARDHTLKSAFQHSVVWFYQELAAQMELPIVRALLERWRYGNATVTGDPKLYWLGGSLRISPNEQVQFIRRLREDQLRLSDTTMKSFRQIALSEKQGDRILYAKTGTGDFGRGWIAWYVGWVEGAENGPHDFAILCRESSFDKAHALRAEITDEVLAEIGFRK